MERLRVGTGRVGVVWVELRGWERGVWEAKGLVAASVEGEVGRVKEGEVRARPSVEAMSSDVRWLSSTSTSSSRTS